MNINDKRSARLRSVAALGGLGILLNAQTAFSVGIGFALPLATPLAAVLRRQPANRRGRLRRPSTRPLPPARRE